VHEGGGAHKTAIKKDGTAVTQHSVDKRRQDINIDELLPGCLRVVTSRKIPNP